ncbi:MAG: hypothetical protein ABSD13_11830 [Candidatus Korobacteraceae bacterium]|jgi:hypothetical protein
MFISALGTRRCLSPEVNTLKPCETDVATHGHYGRNALQLPQYIESRKVSRAQNQFVAAQYLHGCALSNPSVSLNTPITIRALHKP